MARNYCEEKWKQHQHHHRPQNDSVEQEESDEERGEEEEALSLCDLVVSLTEGEAGGEDEETQPLVAKSSSQQEEFEFGRWASGSLSIISEMCAAEDIFYRGQILPLRHSFGSASGRVTADHGIGRESAIPVVNKSPPCVPPIGLNFGQPVSRSESLDRGLQSGFNSFSSRSSSSSSGSITQASSIGSVNTSSDIATTRIAHSKPKVINQFHISHPSPKPQMMRNSNPGMGNSSTQFSRNRNSSIWDFFKLGLVRSPELQDLSKVRGCSVSRNSSSGSSSFSTGNSNPNPKVIRRGGSTKVREESGDKGRKPGFFERRGGAMLSGCSCTVSAVKPIPLNQTTIKRSENVNGKSTEREGQVDKQKDHKLAKGKNNKHGKTMVKKKTVEKLKQKEEGTGKQELSRHRTFEWIKELSHASYIDDDHDREVGVTASLDS